MTDEHQIPWGMPGPTDPAERAWAHAVRLDQDPIRLERAVQWPQDGVEQPDQHRHPTAELDG